MGRVVFCRSSWAVEMWQSLPDATLSTDPNARCSIALRARGTSDIDVSSFLTVIKDYKTISWNQKTSKNQLSKIMQTNQTNASWSSHVQLIQGRLCHLIALRDEGGTTDSSAFRHGKEIKLLFTCFCICICICINICCCCCCNSFSVELNTFELKINLI